MEDRYRVPSTDTYVGVSAAKMASHRTLQTKSGKTSRRAHLAAVGASRIGDMLGRDLKLYTSQKINREPPAFGPSVAPPKIFAQIRAATEERSMLRRVGPAFCLKRIPRDQ